eukprot:TRINITY_DN2128_c0_g1_i4.p1 TRINITY_DN2128_c0_g1~~TRINITY_DN2128_c0_g1_i4.p1  ORF type:complete len:233 (-),score=66.84 TRINITY_DN2128_c0_g1_i4:88-750(-)
MTTTLASLTGGSPKPGGDGADFKFKIALIGDTGAGKTSFMYRASEGQFHTVLPSPTKEDMNVKLAIGGKTVVLMLRDTPGGEKSVSLRVFKDAQAVLLFYDVTDQMSHQNVAQWLQEVYRTAPDNIKKVMIGTKIDLPNRVVATSAAQEITGGDPLDCFFEVSSKSGENFDDTIDKIARLLIPAGGLDAAPAGKDKRKSTSSNRGSGSVGGKKKKSCTLL